VATLSGELSINRFAIQDSDTCGVFLADLSAMTFPTNVDLTAGAISSSGIGACVQVGGYDVSRLQNDVRYFDNGVNLDTTMLRVPEAPPALLR
jgi:hypothetical protein